MFRHFIRRYGSGIACLALLTLPFSAHAARQVALAWDPSPDPSVTGYKVQYGTESGDYTSAIDVGNTTTTTVSNLAPGTNFHFVVTAYRPGSVESIPSNEVMFSSPAPVSPVIQITSPANGTSVNGPISLGIQAQATDPDNLLSKVEFYQGSKKISETSSAPYSTVSPTLSAGAYSFSAVGVDKSGTRWPSDAVTVQVVKLASGQPKIRADGTVELSVSGAPGSTSRVWYSSDLKTWTLLSTVENTTGTVTIEDPNASKVSRRFYKVTSP